MNFILNINGVLNRGHCQMGRDVQYCMSYIVLYLREVCENQSSWVCAMARFKFDIIHSLTDVHAHAKYH